MARPQFGEAAGVLTRKLSSIVLWMQEATKFNLAASKKKKKKKYANLIVFSLLYFSVRQPFPTRRSIYALVKATGLH